MLTLSLFLPQNSWSISKAISKVFTCFHLNTRISFLLKLLFPFCYVFASVGLLIWQFEVIFGVRSFEKFATQLHIWNSANVGIEQSPAAISIFGLYATFWDIRGHFGDNHIKYFINNWKNPHTTHSLGFLI